MYGSHPATVVQPNSLKGTGEGEGVLEGSPHGTEAAAVSVSLLLLSPVNEARAPEGQRDLPAPASEVVHACKADLALRNKLSQYPANGCLVGVAVGRAVQLVETGGTELLVRVPDWPHPATATARDVRPVTVATAIDCLSGNKVCRWHLCIGG